MRKGLDGDQLESWSVFRAVAVIREVCRWAGVVPVRGVNLFLFYRGLPSRANVGRPHGLVWWRLSGLGESSLLAVGARAWTLAPALAT